MKGLLDGKEAFSEKKKGRRKGLTDGSILGERMVGGKDYRMKG
jgi:hypothetical protein